MSKDACKRISDGAKITKTKVLIFGYEGLFSSSSINANLLASYREKLATGQKASRPFFAFGGSFLTRGPLVRIVENYKNKVIVLVFGRHGTTGPGSVPAECARQWMAEKGEGAEGRKVIIVGHSFGGAAASQLAKTLNGMKVPVAGVVTADPRDPICGGECWRDPKPANVAVWENCYQSAPLRGHPVPGANNRFQGAIGHASVQNTPCVYQGIASRIEGVNSPATTAAPRHATEQSAGGNGPIPSSSITGKNNGSSLSNSASRANRIPSLSGSGGFGFGAYAPGGVAAPGSQAEKNWMDRASGNTSASSALAQKIDGEPGVFTYIKPGSDDGSGRRRGKTNSAGASTPAHLINGVSNSGSSAGGAGSGETNSLAPPFKGKGEAAPGTEATTALTSMWSGSGSSASGGESMGGTGLPGPGGGSFTPIDEKSLFKDVSPTAGAQPNSHLAEASPGSDLSTPGITPGLSSQMQADVALSEVSIFHRVHSKYRAVSIVLKKH